MEIRQLKYFITSVEEKSFYKASGKLFVSQPAISKSIALLEKELGTKLLDRTNKGLKLTNKGKKFYHHSKNVLRQIDIMKKVSLDTNEISLTLASYPSKLIASVLTDFYNIRSKTMKIEYREGSVQDIIDFVHEGICEIGVVYISHNQEQAFKHIIDHKHLEFINIKQSELCVYVGDKNKSFKDKKSITIKELSELKYIRGVKDFFSVEHHFDYVSMNEINTAHFKDIILTDSDHLVMEMLKNTDLCYLGIKVKGMKMASEIKIDSKEKTLTLGYIKNKSAILSLEAEEFLSYLTKNI